MDKKQYEVFLARLAEAKTIDEVEGIVREHADVWSAGNTRHVTRKSAVQAGMEAMLPAARNTEENEAEFTVVPSITLPKLVYKLRVVLEQTEED